MFAHVDSDKQKDAVSVYISIEQRRQQLIQCADSNIKASYANKFVLYRTSEDSEARQDPTWDTKARTHKYHCILCILVYIRKNVGYQVPCVTFLYCIFFRF